MTQNPRAPGRVDEPTVGIDADRRNPDNHETHTTGRQPGAVFEPTEAMANDPDTYSKTGRFEEGPAYSPHGAGAPGQKSIGWPWAILALAVLLIVWAALSWIQSLAALYNENVFLGIGVTILSLVALTLVMIAVAKEIRAFAIVDRISARTVRLESAMSSGRVNEARECLQETIDNIGHREPELVRQFEQAASSAATSKDFLRQLDNMVLLELDRKADVLIKQVAMSTGIAVAITPHPAFDAMVVLVQSMRLTRRLGDIYGLSPTGLSAVKLFIYTFNSVALASATHVATDTLIEAFGSDFVKIVGKYATEAGVTGYRVYRLGRMVRKTCRPTAPP